MDVLPVVCDLVGRDALLRAVHQLLAQGARLVTLTGRRGVGTSRLARAALDGAGVRYRVIGLADAVTRSEHLARSLAALDLVGTSETSLAAVAARAAELDEVLLLDGCSAPRPAGELVRALLDGADGLVVVVTGAVALGLPDERVVAVPPLPLPPPDVTDPVGLSANPALRLFVAAAERAAHVRLAEDDLPTVAEVCRRLDGLPAALVLAATRLALMQPSVLLSEMSRLGAWQLVGLSVEDEVERSVALLDDDVRAVLIALAVVDTGASADAVAAIAVTTACAVLDALTLLVQLQLATADASVGRYSLTSSASQHVRFREGGTSAWQACVDRHAAFFAAQARDFARRPHGSRMDPAWLLDHRNRLAALQALRTRGDREGALRLAVDAMTGFEHRGEADAGRRLLAEVLSETPERPSGACIQAHLWLGRLEAEHADGLRTEGAVHHFRAALQLARARGNLVIHLEVLNAVCENQVVLEDGVRLCEEAVAEGLALTEAPELDFGRSVFLAWHSANLHRRLRLREAAETLAEALRIARAYGDKRLVMSYAIFHWQMPPEARQHEVGVPSMRELLEMAQAQGDVRTEGWVWMVVVGNAIDAGDERPALASCLSMLTLARRTSQSPLARQALVAAVRLLRDRGRPDLVVRLADALAPYGEAWRAHLPPRWIADHDEVVAAARAALSGPRRSLVGESAGEAQWRALDETESWLRHEVETRAPDAPGAARAEGLLAPLTPREREVLAALAGGASNKEAARALGLRPKTVAHHCASIYAKLGVRNRTEAVAEALGHGVPGRAHLA